MRAGAPLSRLAAAVLTVGFIAVPAYSLARFGLGRLVLDAAVLQSALELIVVFGLLLAGLRVQSRPFRLVLVTAVIALYLRRHHVDLPAIVALGYLEIIGLIGAAVWRRAGAPGDGLAVAHIPLVVLTGLSVWLALALALAAAGLATPARLGLFALAAGAVSLATTRRLVLIPTLCRQLGAAGAAGNAAQAFVLTLFVMLLAKTNVVLTFDSLWYGLRGEYVLAQGGRIFEPTGLVDFVHYYPKLFELLLLPLAWFGDFSFVLAASIAALGLALVAAFALLRAADLEVDAALIATAVVASLPVLACLALQSKPDVFNTFLLLTAAHCLVLGWKRNRWSYLLFALSALVLSLATKLTSLAYATVLMLPWAAVAWVAWRRRWLGGARLLRSAGWTAIAAAVVAAALTWRTYHLTGFPFVGPVALVEWLRSIGFSELAPVRLDRPAPAAPEIGLLTLFWQYHFWPAPLTYVRLWWPGNLWLLLSLGLLATAGPRFLPCFKRFVVRWWPLLPVVVAGLILDLTVTGSQAGGVPYYHLVAICLLNLIVLFEALRRWGGGGLHLLLGVFAAFHFALVLTIVADSGAGTRGMDLDFGRSVWDTAQYKAREFDRTGLSETARYLRETVAEDEPCRGIAHGYTHTLHLLPCRIETYRSVLWRNRELLSTPSRAAGYLRRFDIRFLIVPLWNASGGLHAVFECLARRPNARVVRDRRYRLLDLRGVDLGPQPACPPPSRAAVSSLRRAFAAASVTDARQPQMREPLARANLSSIMRPQRTIAFQLPPDRSVSMWVGRTPGARFFEMQVGFRSVHPEAQTGCRLTLSATARGKTTTVALRPGAHHVETVRLPWPAGGQYRIGLDIDFVAERPDCREPLLLVNPGLVPQDQGTAWQK